MSPDPVPPARPTPSSSSAGPDQPSGLTSLDIHRWNDPLIDRLGHDPRSRYAERYWLGILGPSTTLFLRLCADELDHGAGAVHLDLEATAARMGIGHRGGRNSPLARSIQRACRFGAARMAGRHALEVRNRLPPLNRAQIERLSPALQTAHRQHVEGTNQTAATRSRARRLALSLMECGDAFDEAERQLDQWRVPAPVAADAVNWAWDRHRAAAEFSPDAA